MLKSKPQSLKPYVNFLYAGSEALSGAPSPRSKVEVIECWHLSPEQHSALLSDCLLPLAATHAPAACRGALLSAPADADAAAPGAPAAGAAFPCPHLHKAAGKSSEANLHRDAWSCCAAWRGAPSLPSSSTAVIGIPLSKISASKPAAANSADM